MDRLDNYEEVKDRLPRFWDCVKQGRIVTEVLDHSENWDRVVIKASLFDGEDLFGIKVPTLKKWVRQRRLSYIKYGYRTVRFREVDLVEFQQINTTRAVE